MNIKEYFQRVPINKFLANTSEEFFLTQFAISDDFVYKFYGVCARSMTQQRPEAKPYKQKEEVEWHSTVKKRCDNGRGLAVCSYWSG